MRSVLLFAVLFFTVPVFAEDKPRDTHERLNGLLWIQTSAEYKTIARQTYRLAWAQIADKLSKAKTGFGIPSAAIEQPGFNVYNLPFAVILDIDETVLDNSPMSARLVETRAGFSSEIWKKWVEKESANFIPGAKEFINKLREANVETIFITNRKKGEEAHTIKDLFPIAISDEKILCSGEKSKASNKPWPSEKLSRREYVAKKYWIIGMVGDDLADFIPHIKTLSPEKRAVEAEKHQLKFGDSWFLLPNPIYGSWESVLYKSASDSEQLKEKMKQIKSYEPKLR